MWTKVGSHLVCQICNRKFEGMRALKSHITWVHQDLIPNSEVVTCPICFKSLTANRNLQMHIHRVHREGKVKCDKCPKKFSCLSELKVHTASVHSSRWRCKTCDKVFCSKTYLKHHELTHTQEYPYHCEYCGKGFPDNGRMASHVTSIHEAATVKCHICDKEYVKLNINKHMLTHDPGYVKPKYSCHICGLEYESRRPVKLHIAAVHEGQKKQMYVCDVCGKEVSSLHSLTKHKRTHTGEKTAVCDDCGKAFATVTQMKTHKRVHTKEKPYTCNICNKSFSQKSTLNVHMRYHTGERPYRCELCSKGFLTNTLLKGHKCKL